MDLSSINNMDMILDQARSSSGSQAAASLENKAGSLSSESTEEELKGVLKDFESYFVEQVLKKMKETFTSEDEDSDATMSQYNSMCSDIVIEQVADELVDQIGGNYTQQLYEQMKRNYNIE